ncbi:uncharacterized protein A4U43_C08F15560 [Asparagus officinalis]|nr:uncharacterized protein A4U43_C08F15560 [Asparagus officinalis]
MARGSLAEGKQAWSEVLARGVAEVLAREERGWDVGRGERGRGCQHEQRLVGDVGLRRDWLEESLDMGGCVWAEWWSHWVGLILARLELESKPPRGSTEKPLGGLEVEEEEEEEEEVFLG